METGRLRADTGKGEDTGDGQQAGKGPGLEASPSSPVWFLAPCRFIPGWGSPWGGRGPSRGTTREQPKAQGLESRIGV